MKTKLPVITAELINSFNPCYPVSDIENEENGSMDVVAFINKYRNKVKNKEDILWVLIRKEFLSDRLLRLFAVWNARKALLLTENPDKRSVNACDVAERHANGKATDKELADARADARAARDAAGDAARAAWAATWAAWDTAWAARAAARAARDARAAARDAMAARAARDAARAAAWDARDAARAAWAAARDAGDAARDAQIDKLIEIFETGSISFDDINKEK